jgi:hypothetical protein
MGKIPSWNWEKMQNIIFGILGRGLLANSSILIGEIDALQWDFYMDF